VRLLLDTHALIWWLLGDPALSGPAREAIGDAANEVFVSAATFWEIATKYRLGKLPEAGALTSDLDAHIAAQDFKALAISPRHASLAGALPGPHRDPFDRMLIAQGLVENLVLVSNEQPFDGYGVSRLW